MDWYVVVDLYRQGSARPLKKLTRVTKLDGKAWEYFAEDCDYKETGDGHIHVFKKEEAARRYYGNAKRVCGEESSSFLVYTNAFTKWGAAKKAIGLFLDDASSDGEILKSYHGNRKEEL